MNQIDQVMQFNFTAAQVAKLFQMQDALNSYIHPEWKTQGFDWDLAILDECMEIHGHLGWKWWKPGYQQGLTEANKKQVQLEVIDLLHFVLSSELVASYEADAYQVLNKEMYVFDLACDIRRMQKTVLNEYRSKYVEIWANLAHSIGLTEQEILETYIQKYVLNKFRQDHGYKDGSYVKIWELEDHYGGLRLEDNYFLSRVVKTLEQEGQDTTDEHILYSELELIYNSRINK